MAANEVTKKLLIYHTLYRLNVSFSNIIKHCQMLHAGEIISAKQVKLFQGYTQELRAEINEKTLGALHSVERNDWYRFGKIRVAEEKRLSDPNDVLIHAQERRQEIHNDKKRKRLIKNSK